MTSDHHLTLAVLVFRGMNNRKFVDGAFTGSLVVDVLNEQALNYLKIEEKITLNGDTLPPVGNSIQIELEVPRRGACYFALHLRDMLDLERVYIDPPKHFYVADLDYYSDENSLVPVEVANFLAVSSFARLLLQVADYFDERTRTAIFFAKKRFEVPIEIAYENLQGIPKLPELEEKALSQPHLEQRQTILKNVLVELVRALPARDRFAACVKNFDVVMRNFSDEYISYVSEFSFDKVRREVQDKKVGHVIKLNGIVTGIQNQVLAIPVSLILAASQMSAADGKRSANLAILVGGSVFTVLMLLLVTNQLGSLASIRHEIRLEKRDLVSKHPALARRLGKTYDELEERITVQRRSLHAISCVSIGSVLVLLILFIDISSGWPIVLAALDWLKDSAVGFIRWADHSIQYLLGVRPPIR